MVLIPFGDWLPDRAEFANPGSLTAKNVIPKEKSYGPFPGLVAQTDALDTRVLGAFSANDASNNVYLYAGNASKLYELVNNSFTDESKVGGYSTAVSDVWEFTKFGDKVIATNFTDPVQSITVGGGSAGAFADHITSTLTPKAKHLGIIRDFLVLGNTNDATDGHVPYRVWWSAIGDSTDFDPDATTQCDFQNLQDGGWVQAIVDGAEYGIIFQEKQIVRMQYSGPPRIFDFLSVDRKRGTPIPNSVVALGRVAFYISEEGFFAFDGTQSIPIGADKVNRTFWNQFDIGNKARVSAAIDPENNIVVWSFPGEGSTGGVPNKLWFYNWVHGRWSEAEISVEILLRAQTQGFTLDGLDSISTNIDTGFTESFDSEIWKGGKVNFAAFDTDHMLAFFNGNNLEATIDTGEVPLAKGKRALVTEFWPLVDGGTVTTTVGGRNRTVDTVSFDSASSLNAVGFCPVRNDSRYHRFRVNITGDWTHAQGGDAIFRPRGKR